MARIHFANFICKFGEDKNLLDFADEIVIPAFLDPNFERTHGDDTRFVLYDVAVRKLDKKDPPTIGIAGRIIKDTILRRDQIFRADKGIIPDVEEIESAPTALFLLILNDHKLVYLPEVSNAPSLKAFGATLHKFINEKRDQKIREVYEYWREREERVTKKQISAAFPKPRILVIPLANAESIRNFVDRFSRLTSVKFELLDTNQELDGAEIWQQVRKLKEEAASHKTALTHHSKDGIKKDAAVDQITNAAAAGNQIVTLRGKDSEGNELKGNNEHFTITVDIGTQPDEDKNTVSIMYEKFLSMKNSGALTTDEMAEDISELINGLLQFVEEE